MKNGFIKQIARNKGVDYESILSKPRRLINIKKQTNWQKKCKAIRKDG